MDESKKSGSPERKEPRFEVRRTTVLARRIAGEVRNLSLEGMAIVTRAGLPLGDPLVFRVRHGDRVYEVEGSVRWSFLRRTAKTSLGDVVPLYHAGVALDLRHDWPAELLLSGLVLTDPESALETGAPAESRLTGPQPLEIRSPHPGAVVGRSPIEVSGIVHPVFEEFAVQVNGLTARVERGRFRALVPLAEGPNSLAATVSSKGSLLLCAPRFIVTYRP